MVDAKINSMEESRYGGKVNIIKTPSKAVWFHIIIINNIINIIISTQKSEYEICKCFNGVFHCFYFLFNVYL